MVGTAPRRLNKIVRNVRGACATSVGCQNENSSVSPSEASIRPAVGTILNIIFLLALAMGPVARFVKTGGLPMLRMMG